ncbi:DNA-binding protein WhiA [uncultured Megasphaera sp.]|uniref:DNA-binding protein WhiA n=1 Tax=uncultured Megasphaera sp. TaxID=165188 RepID=UPI00265A811C|nr:DNA-binding protein WhiA [uncultured Megasphaera sp.]
MSFAEEVKNEIAHCEPENTDCRYAELAALLCMGGALILGSHGHIGMEFSTSNNAVARKALKMWMASFAIRPEVRVRQGLRLRKKNYYILRVPPSLASTRTLQQLSLFPGDREFQSIDLKNTACQRAFLRGAFMGGGSVNQPKGDYHLELLTENELFAQKLLKIMRRFRLPAKMTDRKGAYLVYIKEGNGVSSFLQQIGAAQAYMDFESVRVVKEMRNNVNRVVNCETANLQKTVDAAIRQRRHIERIQASGLYLRMTPKLQEAAELRMHHPEASMSELAALSGMTKSGLAHRFKKIADIADTLEGQDNHERSNNI